MTKVRGVLATVTACLLVGACGTSSTSTGARETSSTVGSTTTTSTTASTSTTATTALASRSDNRPPRPAIGDCGQFPNRGPIAPPTGVSVTITADSVGAGDPIPFHVVAVNNTSEPVQYVGDGNPHEIDVLLGDRFVFVPGYALAHVDGGPVLYLQPGERKVLDVVWHRETCNPHPSGDGSDRYIADSAPPGTYRVAGVWHSWEAPEISVTVR